MKLWILRKKSITAKKLKRKIQELYNIEIHRWRYKLPKDKKYIIINFGNINKNAHVNNKIINKLKQFILLKENNIPIPEFFLNKNDININEYKVLGRKKRHTQGKDIIFINTKEKLDNDNTSDFWVKYIDKKWEFRVHIIGDNAYVCKKIPKEENNINSIIWNYKNGFKFITYTGKYKKQLEQLGINAVKAIKYDFGAVDIIADNNKNFYVLEINACPGLDNKRLEWYAKNFIKYIIGKEEENIIKN